MGSGKHYEDKHVEALKLLQENFSGRDLDVITWTSDPTPWKGDPDAVYNCFGCAVGVLKHWQPTSVYGDPEGDPLYYWPIELSGDAEDNFGVGRFVDAAKTEGFEECSDSAWEPEFEKIVLIHKRDIFCHAALQLSESRWKSKLGEYSNCEHPLEFVLGDYYGKDTIFMKRQRKTSSVPS
jgi:hypothetical protein